MTWSAALPAPIKLTVKETLINSSRLKRVLKAETARLSPQSHRPARAGTPAMARQGALQ